MMNNIEKLNVRVWVLIGVVVMVTGCREKLAVVETYRCPMHHTVVSDEPGVCPICGMELVRQARPGEEVNVTEDLAGLLQSPNEVVVSSIGTIRGDFRTQTVTVAAQGVVTYDTRNIYTLSARISGRLEKVYLKYNFQHVRRGQLVAEIYSPELITAQRELIYITENDGQDQDLVQAAKRKMLLLGASPAQVEQIIRDKNTANTFPIYSPYSGYIIREGQETPLVIASSSSGGMNKPSGEASIMTTNGIAKGLEGDEIIRAGGYVSTGQTLFKIVNTEALRIELSLPLADASSVRIHDKVDLDTGSGKIENAEVDLVQPYLNGGEDFIKLRVIVKQRHDLPIGQLVQATITLKPIEGLWIPQQAVLDLGTNKVVFIKMNGVFKARRISLGLHANDSVQVNQGLASNEEIARDAHYLVDSESFVK